MTITKGTRTLLLLAFIAAVLVALRLLNASWAPSIADMFGGEEVLKTLHRPWFTIGGEATGPTEGLPITPVLIMQAVLFLILLTVGARLGRRLLHTRVLSRTTLDAGQQYAIARISGYAIFLLGLMVGLQTMGLDLSSLTFLGGALGIGIGFGLQAIVNNFVSGIIMLIERPVKLGDRVDVGGVTGDIVKIGPRCTWIRGIDNAVTLVPNSELITGRVTNWTGLDQVVRYRLSVTVAYGTDPEKVRSLLTGIARAHPDVLQDPPPDVLLAALGESGLRFDLRYMTVRQAHTPLQLLSDLHFGVLRAFREHGVEIPYPQRDVHLRSIPESLTSPGRD